MKNLSWLRKRLKSWKIRRWDWKNNSREGIGKYIFKYSGDIYDGDWKKDKMEGKGIYTYKLTGNIYDGDWKYN